MEITLVIFTRVERGKEEIEVLVVSGPVSSTGVAGVTEQLKSSVDGRAQSI